MPISPWTAGSRFFLESEIGRPQAEQSLFHIIPLPFEASVSYESGTEAGPDAIIEASNQLELFDGISSPSELGIFTHSSFLPEPSQNANWSDSAVHDLFGRVEELVYSILQAGSMPVILGGEHSLSFGPIMACRKFSKDLRDRINQIDDANRGNGNKQNDEPRLPSEVGIVQIDAHADLRLAYEGRVWSHASVMRRCADAGIPIAEIGVRALCKEESEYRASCEHLYYWNASELCAGSRSNAIMHGPIVLPKNFPPYIYLSIDVDGLDPSIMPATGTPVPGGLGWYQTLAIIESVILQRKVLAFDLVELAPRSGLHFATYTAAELVYRIMGFIQRIQLDQNRSKC